MEMTVATRLKHAWNTFMNRDSYVSRMSIGPSYGYRPDRPLFSRGNERSIITSVYNRIALDVSSMTVQHVRLDGSDRFKEVIESGLNNCLTVEANVDQTGRAFMQDIVMSMLDEGCVAIIPVDTNFDPEKTGGIDIETMRTGKILEWFPQHVKVRVYNDQRGEKEDILVPKSTVGIVENPFYAVMNEPNSTMQRLIRKLNLLDAIDEQNSSGKLNLIIQLPYVIKTEARRQQAELRRQDIENQLASSKYGVAYTDGTEHVVQLNRPVENNLMSQIEYLTSMLYSQLGLTQGILDGSADDKTMQNYLTRIVEPILSAIVDEIKRKFLTKTARSQKQSILFFRDPFKLVPVDKIAERRVFKKKQPFQNDYSFWFNRDGVLIALVLGIVIDGTLDGFARFKASYVVGKPFHIERIGVVVIYLHALLKRFIGKVFVITVLLNYDGVVFENLVQALCERGFAAARAARKTNYDTVHNSFAFSCSAFFFSQHFLHIATYLSLPPRHTCSPEYTTLPSSSRRALTVAFAPHLHTDLISVMDSAISKSLRLPGNKCVRKSVRRPKHSTGTLKSMTICPSSSTCSGVRNWHSSTMMTSRSRYFSSYAL